MPKTILNDIIVTHEDYILAKSYLRELKSMLYRRRVGKELVAELDSKYSPILSLEIKNPSEIKDKEALADSIPNVIRKLEKMEEVTVTLPFTPTQRFLEQLKVKLGKICLLNDDYYIKTLYDINLVAGCVVECNGTFMDFSMSKVMGEAHA